mgnify:FL=1
MSFCPGQISPRKGDVLNSTRVVLALPEGITEVHYGIQAIDSGFRKGEWVFGTMKVPCESKEEDNSKEKDILKVTNISTMEHTDKIEGLCEDGAMHIARLLEKQGYVTTTWAGGIARVMFC